MVAIGVLATNVFLAAFAGTWTCTIAAAGTAQPSVTRWQIAAVPQSTWASVRWQARGTGGTAYVGYVAPEKHWVYQDFHDDGSYGSSTSDGPQNGLWTWSSVFITPQRIVRGASQWRIVDGALQRGFGRLIGPSFRESAHDTCTRT